MRISPYLALLCLLSQQAAAYSLVFSGRLGETWSTVNKSQHIKLLSADPAADYFQKKEDYVTAPLLGAFFGVELPFYKPNMHWQTGIAAYTQAHAFESEGTDYIFSEPLFNDKLYSYSLENQRLMFENKFLYHFTPRVNGYLLGGIGLAFNRAYNYQELSIDPLTPANGVFAPHSTRSFSYSLGLGMEAEISKNLRLGLGYQFNDLGKFSLGNYNNGNTNQTINNNHTTTQEVVLQITKLL